MVNQANTWPWLLLAFAAVAISINRSDAADPPPLKTTEIDGYRFQHPGQLKVRRVATQPLVQWPICADFSPDGKLFVAESSGSNAPVKEQLETKTHRIVCLEDTDGDGNFDKRTLFADNLMFPEGILWYQGTILVGAPPQIWQLHDQDGDGVSEKRDVWFDGETLTRCANDLHGPYLGRDGWVYWCKGAFAEQKHQLPDGSTLTTSASHIFRRHPTKGWIEPVMTGGMDNPVEFAVNSSGDRFFTSTFVQHPAGGKRDGLVHAIYGGVYGKIHEVIDSHPQTGPVMPIMKHLGPAAPSGLACLQTDGLGMSATDQLVVSHFNLQKVSLHRLNSQGGSYVTEDSDLLVCDRIDFHPTDVLEDADGSLLVVDTGGWYRLCCPTSHMDQQAALGGIYRLEKSEPDSTESATGTSNTKQVPSLKVDPRGKDIAWENLAASDLCQFLADPRPAVRKKAQGLLVKEGDNSVPSIAQFLKTKPDPVAATESVWTLCQIDTPAAESVLRNMVHSPIEPAALAALESLALRRASSPVLVVDDNLETPFAQAKLRRSLEWGARSNPSSEEKLSSYEEQFASLLAKQKSPSSRIIEHAMAYALFQELKRNPSSKLASVAWTPVSAIGMNLAAPEKLPAKVVLDWLNHSDDSYRQTALWLLSKRGDWNEELAASLPKLISELNIDSQSEHRSLVAALMDRTELDQAIGELLKPDQASKVRMTILQSLANRPRGKLSENWAFRLMEIVSPWEATEQQILALQILARDELNEATNNKLDGIISAELSKLKEDSPWIVLLLAASPTKQRVVNDVQFQVLLSAIAADRKSSERARGVQALGKLTLNAGQQLELARKPATVGPMELGALLEVMQPYRSLESSEVLLDSLASSPVAAGFPTDRLKLHFAEYPPAIKERANRWIEQSAGVDLAAQGKRLNQLLEKLPAGEPIRGFQIFHSSKASCGACHEIGYRGGNIGPDLSRIGGIRSRRDLLEAILYPNASFVRSYEPVTLQTVDGEVFNGLLQEETAEQVTLVSGADQRRRLDRDDIELIKPSKTSVMPSGLEQILSESELADLLAFLESSK